MLEPRAEHLSPVFYYTSTVSQPRAGVVSAVAGARIKAYGIKRGTSKYQIKKGFLKKATWISKPDKQDLIDFVVIFVLFLNSLFVVHLLKSSQSHALEQDFSTSTLLTIWGWIILCVRGCPVFSRMFSGISGLYPLDASSSCAHSCNENQKCLHTLPGAPWGADSPPCENHWSRKGSPRPGLMLLITSRSTRMKLC